MTEKPRNTLLGCLKVVLGLVLLLFLMFAGAVGWGIYANDRMQAQSTAFCSAVKPGQDIASVLERARGDGAPSRSSHDGDVYRFHWQGWVFNAHECVVTTAAGRVVSAEHVAHED